MTAQEKQRTHPIQVGDIFVNSWGYDQTNVDAYQVVRVTPSTVRIREISTSSVEGSDTSWASCRVVPNKDHFCNDQEVTKRPYHWDFGGEDHWALNFDHGASQLHEDGNDYHCSWYA